MFFYLILIILLTIYLVCVFHRSITHFDRVQPDEYHPSFVYHIPVEDRPDLIVEDRHNVHNTCLKTQAFNVIQNLRDSDRHQFTIESAIKAIHHLIEYSIDTDLDKLDHAELSLLLIEKIDATYTTGLIKETELLRLIWERIQHPINYDNREQLENNLIEQLADCKHGTRGLHCCEGRIMRLLQTLEGCDSQGVVNLRPMWAFKEEIVNKILYYRNKLLMKVPPIYALLDQKADLTNFEQSLLDAFNQCLIKNLNKRFEIDYLSQGLLTPSELVDIIQPYYENL